MDRSDLTRLLPGLAVAAAMFAVAAIATPDTIDVDKATTGSVLMQAEKTTETTHAYAGMWVTANRNIRHELLPNGRYVEVPGGHMSSVTKPELGRAIAAFLAA